MKRMLFILSACLSALVAACQPGPNLPQKIQEYSSSNRTYSVPDHQLKTNILSRYDGLEPRYWGENVPGVKRRLATKERVIALTLDAYGENKKNDYDKELIDYLRKNRVPATLFVNSRWIDEHYWTFIGLSRNPLFQIENLGGKPLSINGKQVPGAPGTRSASEVFDEVMKNHRKIQYNTGRQPKFFRSATGYYDEIAVKIANEVGETVVSCDVNGDGGGTFSSEQVKHALLSAKPGSIIRLHMNQPKKDTAEGVMKAIPELTRRGYRFVRLQDYPLQ